MNTTNRFVLDWIEEMQALTQPDNIVWIDGSEEQAEALRAEACASGEIIKLSGGRYTAYTWNREND